MAARPPGGGLRSSRLATAIRRHYWGPGPIAILRRALGVSPRLYVAYYRWRDIGPNVLDGTTDLVIEGAPGSANSYAREILREANPDLQVASHLHAPEHVLEAIRRDLPCVLLLREPGSATVSIVSRHPVHLAKLGWAVHSHLQGWERHYQRLADVVDQILLLRFEDVTTDPVAYAQTLNGRFGLGLIPPTPDVVEAAMRRLRRWEESRFGTDVAARTATPGNERGQVRATIRRELDEPVHAELRDRCETLYRSLVTAATPLR